MSKQKELVLRQYIELINNKNLSIIDEDMHPDFEDQPVRPDAIPGRDGVRAWISHLHEVVPDLHVTIHDIVEEGDRVAVRASWTGTHTGLFFGIPPTGKRFTMKGMVFWRIEDGKIRERWATLDQLDLRRQLEG